VKLNLSRAIFLGENLFNPDEFAGVNEIINGKENGGFYDKVHFANIVRAMGYRAPRQVVILKDFVPSTIEQAVDFAFTWNGEGQEPSVVPDEFFCKPCDGIAGRGIKEIEGREALVDFLRNIDRPYIVQEYLPPEQDMRYFLQKTASGKAMRGCYEKMKPEIIGDGVGTVRALIARDESIPVNAKRRFLRALKGVDGGDLVPLNGQKAVPAETKNTPQGVYGVMVEGDELREIDEFMTQFISDLEERAGGNLSRICFDFGIMSGDGDLKDRVVFYEFQMPFGYSGYKDCLSGTRERVLVAMNMIDSV